MPYDGHFPKGIISFDDSTGTQIPKAGSINILLTNPINSKMNILTMPLLPRKRSVFVFFNHHAWSCSLFALFLSRVTSNQKFDMQYNSKNIRVLGFAGGK